MSPHINDFFREEIVDVTPHQRSFREEIVDVAPHQRSFREEIVDVTPHQRSFREEIVDVALPGLTAGWRGGGRRGGTDRMNSVQSGPD